MAMEDRFLRIAEGFWAKHLFLISRGRSMGCHQHQQVKSSDVLSREYRVVKAQTDFAAFFGFYAKTDEIVGLPILPQMKS